MPPRRFSYLADPLMLTGVAAYWVHKLCIKPWSSAGLLHDYLNDFLLIPIFLPPTLLLHRLLRIRTHDRPPTAVEIAIHLALWSVLFLLVFPRFDWLYRHSTVDPYNVVAFAAGAVIGWGIWNCAFTDRGRRLIPTVATRRLPDSSETSRRVPPCLPPSSGHPIPRFMSGNQSEPQTAR